MGVITASPSPVSALNPNAPPFVPAAYRAVEDFSDQWWALIQSSPYFRDYWLQERFADPQLDDFFSDGDAAFFLPDDLDAAFFDDDSSPKQEAKNKGDCTDLIKLRDSSWRKTMAERPRGFEKAPKIVCVKMSPRMIQQPR